MRRSKRYARSSKQYPGARFNVRRFENGPPIEAPIAVRVRGPDIHALTEIAADVERLVRATPGTRDVSNPLAARLVDLDMNIDTAAASLRGVPAGSIDQTLRIAIGGVSVAAYRDPVGDSYPVVLRAPRDNVMTVEDLDRLYVWNASGAASPTAELASPQLQSGPAQINRFERERTVTIRAYTQFGQLTSEVTKDVAKPARRRAIARGLFVEFRRRGGSAETEFRRAVAGHDGGVVRHHGGAAARVPFILDRPRSSRS